MNNETTPDEVGHDDVGHVADVLNAAAGEATPDAPVITDDSYAGKALKEVAALENAAVVQGPKMVKYAWPPMVSSAEAALLAGKLEELLASYKSLAASHVESTRAEVIARHASEEG